MTVVVYRDAELLAAATAARLVTALADAQAARGTASVVLTGGRTGTAVLAAVRAAPARDAVDWSRVDFYWGDERFLPAGDPERNETQARSALLDHVPVVGGVHPMAPSDGEFGDDPDAAAEPPTPRCSPAHVRRAACWASARKATRRRSSPTPPPSTRRPARSSPCATARSPRRPG